MFCEKIVVLVSITSPVKFVIVIWPRTVVNEDFAVKLFISLANFTCKILWSQFIGVQGRGKFARLHTFSSRGLKSDPWVDLS